MKKSQRGSEMDWPEMWKKTKNEHCPSQRRELSSVLKATDELRVRIENCQLDQAMWRSLVTFQGAILMGLVQNIAWLHWVLERMTGDEGETDSSEESHFKGEQGNGRWLLGSDVRLATATRERPRELQRLWPETLHWWDADVIQQILTTLIPPNSQASSLLPVTTCTLEEVAWSICFH